MNNLLLRWKNGFFTLLGDIYIHLFLLFDILHARHNDLAPPNQTAATANPLFTLI
jgi:hypothetical protein